MGLCNSNSKGNEKDAEEIKKNRQIEDQMIIEQDNSARILKLLFLGAGESGKSTLFKALRTIYGEGFSDEVRQEFVPTVWANTISAMQALVQNVDTFSQIASPESKESKKYMEDIQKESEMSDEIAKHIKRLWNDEAIKTTYENRSQFQIFDSAVYFFERIDEIASPEYIPNQQDILRSRIRTTGIVESSFVIDGNNFKIFDVGGQRNERKKWIHCFEDVTAVIFVVGISAYDLVLFEDEETNRMKESLVLFDEICNSVWFKNTSMILFLNKKDLFKVKIKTVPLTVCFEDYSGTDGDEDAAKEFIKNKFIEKNQNPRKSIYPHFTTATDTAIIQNVFDSVKDIIISKSLVDAGLY